MIKDPTILKNRAVISITGADRKAFLQALITNDINKVSETQAIYTFLLSPQGRFLYDFFIIEKDGKLLLDCDKSRVDEIVQKLSFYKLRLKIEIKKEDLDVVVSDNKIGFADPRNSGLGFRSIISSSQRKLGSTSALSSLVDPSFRWDDDGEGDGNKLYNFRRINLKIPDDSDLTFDKSFPLEFGFDNLNTIDYQKGCYVGQETTARTHYKGTIRKKIFVVEIPGANIIEKGAEIECDGKKIGEILSSVFYQNKLTALALIKNLDNEGKEINLENLKLTVLGQEIKLIK